MFRDEIPRDIAVALHELCSAPHIPKLPMPHGFLTIEQWNTKKKRWVPIAHLNAKKSMTDALRELERKGKPGFFRVVQTQRMVWAERANGKLRLRKWHASSLETLARTARAFERNRGKWPA